MNNVVYEMFINNKRIERLIARDIDTVKMYIILYYIMLLKIFVIYYIIYLIIKSFKKSEPIIFLYKALHITAKKPLRNINYLINVSDNASLKTIDLII